jgi:hypothetical protein
VKSQLAISTHSFLWCVGNMNDELTGHLGGLDFDEFKLIAKRKCWKKLDIFFFSSQLNSTLFFLSRKIEITHQTHFSTSSLLLSLLKSRRVCWDVASSKKNINEWTLQKLIKKRRSKVGQSMRNSKSMMMMLMMVLVMMMVKQGKKFTHSIVRVIFIE